MPKFLFFLCPLLLAGWIGYSQWSVKNDTALDTVYWQPIKESDILWSKTVGRYIDLRELANKPLSYRVDSPDLSFYRCMSKMVHDGSIKAFAADNRNLVNEISADSVTQLENNWQEKITGLYLYERWIFDKEKGRMIVRIASIGPATKVGDSIVTFYLVSYKDAMPYLAYCKTDIVSGKTHIGNWLEYFEQRRFTSRITYVEQGITEKIQEKPRKRNKRRRNADDSGDYWVY